MGRGRNGAPLHLLKIVAAAAVLVAAAAVQRPAIGEAAPLLPLRDLDGREVTLESLMGERGLVILFWAGWSDRSMAALNQLETLRAEVAPRGVGFAAVNVEHEHMTPESLAAVRSTVANLKVGFPILVDDGLKLFRAYGVVSVPSTAVVAQGGKLAGFVPGFSTTSREAMIDAIHGLAGITRTAAAPPPKGAPAALRWLQLGRSELAGGREAAARTAFERSAKADPALAEPVVELAALAIDAGDNAGAKALLDRAIGIEADSPAAAREQARLDTVEGRSEQAIAKLKPLAAAGKDPAACEYLGLLLGAAPDAAGAFACAAKAGGPDDTELRSKPVGEAMRLYRRAAALKQ